MLLKLGVSIEKLDPRIRKVLAAVENCFLQAGEELVVTSTFEGSHMVGSLHYANLAFDVRLPKDPLKMLNKLKLSLGSMYDVVLEPDHIHIEYDPK